jgi:NADH-quinone oxidoreductase subunit J
MSLLQIMMYIGGMLVMILFMVLFMHDPGGAMMAGMPDMLSPIERLFSMGLRQEEKKQDAPEQHAGKHSDQREATEHSMQHGKPERKETHVGHSDTHAGHHMQHAMQHKNGTEMDGKSKDGMDMGGMDMSMVTPVRPLAVWIAGLIGIGLALVVLLRPAWPVQDAHPDLDSARAVGMLLMDKYMIAFEGAGFLILLGIFGAVFLARVERHPDTSGRDQPVARPDAPPKIAPDPLLTPGRNTDHHKPPHDAQEDRTKNHHNGGDE